ncbi:MAG: histidine kinase [Gemmatimonadetes bacterium]|nr:histidine kinase [Gemmatimonadota bacterium]
MANPTSVKQMERRSVWLYVFAAWTLYGVCYSVIWTVAYSTPAEALHWTVPSAFAIAWTWAFLTPVVFRLAALLAPRRVGWVVSIAGHAMAAFVLASLVSEVRRQAVSFFGDRPVDPYLPVMVWWLDVWVFVYITLVVIGRALEAQRRYADRVMRADLLETQLARTQLQYLESQLQPHFLFNALNTIQELAHETPATAARMLRRLRALLAISLERRGEDEVSLADELAGLEPYLDIQRTRFSDWLRVEVDVPEALRRGLVPHLLLQPLVENAIRHGFSGRLAPGWIRISATRPRGDRLRLVVEDDGVGLRGSALDEPPTGIGLSNVVERLRQLYGRDHQFTIRNRSEGGVEVVVEVPWQPSLTRRVESTPAALPEEQPADWKTGEFPGATVSSAIPVAAAAPQVEASPALSVRIWLGIAGVWLLLAIFWTNQVVLFGSVRPEGTQMEVWTVASLQLGTSLIWLGLSLPVLWVARRYRFTPENWPRRLPVHVLLALACGVIHVWGLRMMGLSQQPVFSYGNLNPLTGDFFIYLAILAWSHSRDFVAWYRMRAVETARLTAQLARSRFQAVRIQLRPEFVLATLEHLESVVHEDADRAERLITRLADTLRLTLEIGRRPTTSVARELELVSACIESHRLGVRPGVQLVQRVDSEAMTDLVPSRIVCAAVDELLANAWIEPTEPLVVEVDATRLSGTTRIAIRAKLQGRARAGGSHLWWHRHGLAERAVELAGNTVSVLVPDPASILLIIGDDAEAAVQAAETISPLAS